MIRKLLATTALVAVAYGGAIAQTNNVPANNAPIFSPDMEYAPSVSPEGYFSAEANQVLATNLIGKTVYARVAADGQRSDEMAATGDSIGDINDLVIGSNGQAEAVVIGVGGFLGIGEKDVAVDFDRLSWSDYDGERYLTIDATAEQLESAPAFDRSVFAVARVEDQPDTAVRTETAPAEDRTAAAQTETAPVEDRAARTDDGNMQPVDITSVAASDLIGTRVYSLDNEDVGEVGDLIVTDDGKVEAFIVDVGGFLGIGEKNVAMQASNIELMSDGDGELMVKTKFTRAQFDEQVAYSEERYLQDKSTSSM